MWLFFLSFSVHFGPPLVLFEYLPQLSLSFRMLVIPLIFLFFRCFFLPSKNLFFLFLRPPITFLFICWLIHCPICSYLFLSISLSLSLSRSFCVLNCIRMTTGILCYGLPTNACVCFRFGECQVGFQNQNNVLYRKRSGCVLTRGGV